MKRGFVSGILLALLIACGVFVVTRPTEAQASSEQAMPNSTLTSAASTPLSSGATDISAGSPGVYVALGDSVAAGLGLPLVSNASTLDTQCGRSSDAYSTIVAAETHTTLMSYACSGATAGDLFTKQGVSGPNIAPQLSQAYANGVKPSLITITAGANDVQWSTFIKKCYAATCGTATDNLVAKGALAVLEAKLYYLLSDIQLRNPDNQPTVVLTGYYNPISAGCIGKVPGLTSEEVNWLQSNVDDLNNTIQEATRSFSFAKFAAVDFSTHDICSVYPYVQGLNDPAPIHPTATGQFVIAQSILATLQQQSSSAASTL